MNQRSRTRTRRVSAFALLCPTALVALATAATPPAPAAKPAPEAAPAAAAAPAAPAAAPAADPSRAWSVGVAAYERGDYAAYLAAFEGLAKVAPDHPMVMMRLASGYALNGRTAEAIRTLSRLADLGIWTDLAPDGDFKSLTAAPDAAGLRLRLQALRDKRVQSSVAAFRLKDSTLVPEGVAFDVKTGAYFVSSQYQRKIVRRTGDGAATDFVQPGQGGLWMVFGIVADPVRRLLWAASTAEETMKGATAEDAGRTALFLFDLDTGALKRTFPPPAGEDATFDDVALGPEGEVYVSDSASGTIYAATRDARRLEVVVSPGQLGSPQGMAVSADGRRLYVSDYGRGLFSVDVQAGIAIRMRAPAGMPVLGIDGLARAGQCLIAVQNGVQPHKVLRLRLSDDRQGVASVEALDLNLPEMDEPTLGVVSTEGFVYVANSQDGKFRAAHGDFTKYKAAEPLLLRIPTAQLCP